MPALPEKILSKSKMSMFLRSQCDRQLYLSLFKNKPDALNKAGIPVPIKARTNVQLVTASGREFELEEFDRLVAAIPEHVVHAEKYSPIPLDKALSNAPVPGFILQPSLEPEDMREQVLANLGLTKEEQTHIPPLTGLRPDVLYVHKPKEGDYEVLPDGSRKQIAADEQRLAISVIDLKNVTEANASYAAEVCLYALFIANWLAADTKGLRQKYFVSDKVYLWQHVEMPTFEKALKVKSGATPAKRISALLTDLADGLVEFLIFMPSVRKFFKEDVPRVVATGDVEGWAAVPYHVNPKCGACDFLGHKDWLWGEDLKQFEAHTDHYCLPAAEQANHLCKMTGLSRGATEMLVAEGRPTVATLVDIPPNTPVLKRHALLKRDKSQIGQKAKSLETGVSSVDTQLRLGGLARYLDAEFNIVVNFDAGAGFLTGIAVRGVVFAPYGEEIKNADGTKSKTRVFKEEAFVVGKDSAEAEWAALYGFISTLSTWASQIRKLYDDNGWKKPRTQLCFWESRQYQELCNGFGRHLLRVLDLPDRDARALAWIFPAEELMERDEQIAPGIVFINDVVEMALRLPVRFANTLLSVADAYHLPKMEPRKIDNYYREPLGNSIPRERIFEIWNCPTGVIRMYGRPVSLAEATKKYGDVLGNHTWALASISARLRNDLRDCLKSAAPVLNLSNPAGATKVAYDSKLWIQWDRVNAKTAKTAGNLNLNAKSERLEASYKTIVLPKLIKELGNHRYEFEVSDESTEAKLEEGQAYYVLAFPDIPGFPLETAKSLGVHENPTNFEPKDVRIPLHKIIKVKLEHFDRINRKAVIVLRPGWPRIQHVFDALFSNGLVPLTTQPVCILEGLPFDDSKKTELLLREVGNPACAVVAEEAILAMGKKPGQVAKGKDSQTPLASVLWEADKLSETTVRGDADAEKIAADAQSIRTLNPSQVDAVRACASRQLSVIWGPPGTGKTDTLVSLLHALVRDSQTKPQSRKFLISGPNYRTVEELSERLVQSLDSDPSCKADIFWVYSKNRVPKELPPTQAHLHAASVQPSNADDETEKLRASLSDPGTVTIVSTTAHIVDSITRLLHDDGLVKEIFDVVVIDESSQVPVTLALCPLSTLAADGQVVVAGDHLQMPPISQLDPPKGAEHLVGSVQTYLLDRFKLPRQELLINYRSNQSLVDYAKTLGYPPRLQAHNPDRRIECIEPLQDVISSLPNSLPVSDLYAQLLEPERRVTALIHDDAISSQANEIEAKLVAGLAYCLRHSASSVLYPKADTETYTPFTDDDFFKFGLGVVTPHKAQKALVLRELMGLFPDADPKTIFEAVDTVERFQGGERQTVIVSFGVGDTDIIEGEELFLLQMERTNVAVSRAKAKCIVLMPKALAYHLPSDPKAVKTSKALKSYIEEYCSNRLATEITLAGQTRKAEVRWR